MLLLTILSGVPGLLSIHALAGTSEDLFATRFTLVDKIIEISLVRRERVQRKGI